MNDYKELLEKARYYECLVHSPTVAKIYRSLMDAIEQLMRERDAAVADLETATLTTYPCHFCGKVNNCKHDNLGIMCMGRHMNMSKREFEWRGAE